MFDTSPFQNPTFLLQWQVHVVVVALFAIVGVWAGMTRRPWFVAPTLLAALLWLFVPLEAPEPAALLLVGTLGVAITCRLLRHWLMPLSAAVAEQSETDKLPANGSRWRFNLSDTLWLMFVASLAVALLAQLRQHPWNQRFYGGSQDFAWQDLALSGLSLVALAAATLAFRGQPTWRRKSIAALGLFLLIIAVAVAHQLLLKRDFILLNNWEGRLNGPFALLPSPIAWEEIFAVYLLTAVEFVGIVGAGVLLLWPLRLFRGAWFRRGQRFCCGSLLLLGMLGLGAVYAEILDRPTWPAEVFPATNGRDRMRQILAEQHALNPGNNTVQGLEAIGKADAARRVAESMNELDLLLRTEEIVLFDSRSDTANDASLITSLQESRSMARTLKAHAEADWSAGKRKDALQHDMLCLRLGAAWKRGLAVDTLVGMALEGMATHHLCSVRKNLRCEDTNTLQTLLRDIDRQREPIALVIERDHAWSENAYGWRGRLDCAAERIVNSKERSLPHIVAACQRRDATIALLRTDLAIRCFQERHNRWPTDLQELADKQQTPTPLDPFSGKPLLYRAQGADFVLYSVGYNGIDDNGHFGTWSDQYQPGFDLDLDVSARDLAALSVPIVEPAAANSDTDEAVTQEPAD